MPWTGQPPPAGCEGLGHAGRVRPSGEVPEAAPVVCRPAGLVRHQAVARLAGVVCP
jgi:hypothetical protein